MPNITYPTPSEIRSFENVLRYGGQQTLYMSSRMNSTPLQITGGLSLGTIKKASEAEFKVYEQFYVPLPLEAAQSTFSSCKMSNRYKSSEEFQEKYGEDNPQIRDEWILKEQKQILKEDPLSDARMSWDEASREWEEKQKERESSDKEFAAYERNQLGELYSKLRTHNEQAP